MTTLALTIIGMIAAVLTLWLLVIPAGMLGGTFVALRHRNRHSKGYRKH